MAEHARTNLGLDVRTGSLKSFQSERRFDLVSMIQVIAHFIDPRRALEISSRVTRPGGYLLTETWDRRSWTARVLGRHWHEYSPPSVLHWFSRHGLAKLTEQCGYQTVAQGRPAKWLNGAHAKSLLRFKLGQSRMGRLAAAIAGIIPDALAVPYPAEDLFWMLCQRA